MLRTHWVLVVMDHYTRRIIGFGIHAGMVNGEALCRMFKRAIRGMTTFPRYLSFNQDPLYRFHQWEANLRILGVTETKTIPYVPWSHPFIKRLIATIRRECLDRLLFWTAPDLETKLIAFQDYYKKTSNSLGAGGSDSDQKPGVQTGELEMSSLADALSWAIPNTDGGMSTNSPAMGFQNSPEIGSAESTTGQDKLQEPTPLKPM
jgi:hypothetical protein